MKLRDGGTTLLIVFVSLCAIGYLSSLWLEDDNVVEEACEQVIENQMGIDIDLTPNSMEK